MAIFFFENWCGLSGKYSQLNQHEKTAWVYLKIVRKPHFNGNSSADFPYAWVISHVPMFHITQPLGINGLFLWLLFLVMSNIPKSWDSYQPLLCSRCSTCETHRGSGQPWQPELPSSSVLIDAGCFCCRAEPGKSPRFPKKTIGPKKGLLYTLVNIQKAIEHGHRNSGFSHE